MIQDISQRVSYVRCERKQGFLGKLNQQIEKNMNVAGNDHFISRRKSQRKGFGKEPVDFFVVRADIVLPDPGKALEQLFSRLPVQEQKMIRGADVQLEPIDFAHRHGDAVGAVYLIGKYHKGIASIYLVFPVIDVKKDISFGDKGNLKGVFMVVIRQGRDGGSHIMHAEGPKTGNGNLFIG